MQPISAFFDRLRSACDRVFPGADGVGLTGPDDRGVSEVVAVVLLVGLVVTGAIAVTAVMSPAVETGRDRATIAHAEQSMRALDGPASGAAGGGAGDRIDMGLSGGEGSLYRSDGGWLRVDLTTHGRSAVVANRSLGAVVYEQGETTVAYQGGGVFRSDEGSAVWLSAPDVSYSGETLTVSLLSLDGDRAISGDVGLSEGDRYTAFPGRPGDSPGTGDVAGGDDDSTLARDVEHPLAAAIVTVTVHGDYYEAWGAYFEETLPGTVEYDHRNRTASVTLRSLEPPIGTAGIIATSPSGSLALEGRGAYTDSYDSSAGTYSETRTDEGTVRAAGDIYETGRASIRGNIRSGATVTLEGTAEVEGDVYWTDDHSFSGDASISGETGQIDGVESLPPVDGVVERSIEQKRRNNDNDATPAITDGELSITGSSAELGAGSYYFEQLDLQGKDLVLNTSEGDIEIAVRDWLRVTKDGGGGGGGAGGAGGGGGNEGGEIRVVGDGDVRVFVGARDDVTVRPTGLGSRSVNLHVGKGSAVRTPNHHAPQFQVFAPRTFNGTIAGSESNNATFDGVVYAPAGRDGPGSVYVMHGNVYGAVVTGDLSLKLNGAVHFDQAISAGDSQSGPSDIDYLHVLVRELLVED